MHLRIIFFATCFLALTVLRAETYLSVIPGPDDTGGMVMPGVNFNTGTKSISISLGGQPDTVYMYSLQAFDVYGEHPFANAVFNPSLSGNDWYNLLDPTQSNLPFSTQFGFYVTSGNVASLPDGAYVFIKAISISDGLRGYDVGYWEDVWGDSGSTSASEWYQVFGEGALWDNTVAWGDNSGTSMWHPVFVADGPGNYSATFEIYLGDGYGNALEDWSSATITLNWVVVPEPSVLALAAAGGLAALVFRTRRSRERERKCSPRPGGRRCRRPSESGVTFVELLGVVVVSGILAAMGYAGYQSMLERGRSAECLSKMRNLAQGILLCAQDEGTFPKTSHSGGSWAKAVSSYLGEPDLADGGDYRRRPPFRCPSNSEAGSDGNPSWSYAMNVFFELSSERRYTPAGLPLMSKDSYEGSPQTWHRPVNVSHPSRTILLAENAGASRASDHFMAHQWTNVVSARNVVASSRHPGGSHFAFVDGHVETLPIEKTFDPVSGVNLWNPSLAGSSE